MSRGPVELIRLARMDLRPYLGTLRDWSSYGEDGAWIASQEPEFKRTNDDVIGLFFEDGDVISSPAEMPGTRFSIEVAFKPRTPFGYGGQDGYLWSTPPEIPVGYGGVTSTGALTMYCSTAITSAAGVVKDGVTSHVVFTRDDSLDGKIIHNGQSVVASGAVGNGTGTPLYIGNRNLFFDKSFRGLIYLIRLWHLELTVEEASLLYEMSRPLIIPGNHKRSGIITPAGG